MTIHITRALPLALRICLVTLFTLATAVDVAAQCAPVFPSAPSYATDRQSNSVAIGEFNGDGKLDLAGSNLGADNVSVLLGDGVGGFGPPSNIPVRHLPSAVVTADFNKDGKTDLAVSHGFGSGIISVLFGNGNGTFSDPTDVGNASGAVDLAVADFNNDCNPDIAVASRGFQIILLENGAGAFASNTISVTPGSSVVAADLNGDGFQDAAGVFWPNLS